MHTLVPVDRHERRRLLSASYWFRRSKPSEAEYLDIMNPAARTPLVLADDESGSMDGPPINEVNRGTAEMAKEFAKNPAVCRTVELAVVGFGRSVGVRHPFAPPGQFRPLRLKARGGTPLAEAGLLCVRMIERRLDLYRQAEIDLKVRPHVFFLTDGAPTSSASVVEQFVRELTRHENDKIAAYHALYTQDADPSELAQIFVREPRPLANFLQGLRAISQSVTYASQHIVTPDFDLAENLPRAFETHRRDDPWPRRND